MPARKGSKAGRKATMEKIAVANLSIASNSSLLAIKLVAGFLMGSVAVVAEGVHSGIDIVAALIAAFAVRKSGKPADSRHAYGHGKYESMSGLVEGALIFVAAIIIIYESVHRFLAGAAVEHLGWGIVVMGVSMVVNVIVSRCLLKVARKTESLALEADGLHLSTDVITSLGVLVGLALIYLTGMFWLDPVVAIIVALIIIKAAYDLTRRATSELIDESISEEEVAMIKKVVGDHQDMFADVHSIRTRKAGGVRHIDLHVVVHKDMHVHDAHDIAHHICDEIREALAGRCEVLVHVEPCDTKCERCNLDCRDAPDPD